MSAPRTGTLVARALLIALGLALIVTLNILRRSPSTSEEPVSSVPIASMPAKTAIARPAMPPRRLGWVSFDAGKSAMDDSETVSVGLDAEEPIKGWLKELNPVLIARCKEGKSELYAIFGTAMVPEYGRFQESSVRVRLDDGKARKEYWGQSTDDQALFAPRAVPLMREIARAEILRLEVTPFNSNPAVATFHVGGFAPHMAEIARACRWK